MHTLVHKSMQPLEKRVTKQTYTITKIYQMTKCFVEKVWPAVLALVCL